MRQRQLNISPLQGLSLCVKAAQFPPPREKKSASTFSHLPATHAGKTGGQVDDKDFENHPILVTVTYTVGFEIVGEISAF
jgi:hypothetical protein